MSKRRNSRGVSIPPPTSPLRLFLVNNQGKICRAALFLFIMTYFGWMLRISFHLVDNLGVRTFDLAIFDQATWLIAHGKPAFVTVRGLHLLAEHFSAILYLIAPFYLLWDSPKVLLTLQTLALALGAIPVYSIAARRLGSPGIALIVAVCYLLYPPMQWANTFEFHPDNFATLFLLCAIYCFEVRRWAMFYALMVLAALCKETVGLEVLAFSAYAYFPLRKESLTRFALGSAAVGVVMLALAFATMHDFNHGRPSLFFLLYEQYGSTAGGIILFMAIHPVTVIKDLLSRSNLAYGFEVLYPVMFMPLMAPEVALIALPALLVHLLSGHAIMHTIYFQYTALVTPFIFYAVIIGLERVTKWGSNTARAMACCILALGTFQGYAERPGTSGVAPLPPTMTASEVMQSTAIFSRIPSNASVSTQVALMSRLGHRDHIYMFPNPFMPAAWGYSRTALDQMGGDAFSGTMASNIASAALLKPVDYVVLCPPTTAFPLQPHDKLYVQYVQALVSSPAYGIVAISRDTMVLKSGASHRLGLSTLAAQCGASVTDPLALLLDAWFKQQIHVI